MPRNRPDHMDGSAFAEPVAGIQKTDGGSQMIFRNRQKNRGARPTHSGKPRINPDRTGCITKKQKGRCNLCFQPRGNGLEIVPSE